MARVTGWTIGCVFALGLACSRHETKAPPPPPPAEAPAPAPAPTAAAPAPPPEMSPEEAEQARRAVEDALSDVRRQLEEKAAEIARPSTPPAQP